MQNKVETVKAALRGDHEAFRCLVEMYQEAIYMLILSSVHDEFQSQDLTQETIIRAYLNLEKLKEPAKFGPWLRGIARNVSGKWLKRHHPHESFEDYLENGWIKPEAESSLPDEFLQERQADQGLWVGIYSLSEASREILILFYMRRMDHRRISGLLGISETASRNRLHRAKRSLKEVMEMQEKTQGKNLPDGFTDKVIAEAMKQGEEYLKKREWEQAKQAFLRAADVQEGYAPAYRGIGLAAREQVLEMLNNPSGDFDKKVLEEAYEELSRAYRLGDRELDTARALGQLYEKFGRSEEAGQFLWDYYEDRMNENPDEAFAAGSDSLRIMSHHPPGIQPGEVVERHKQFLNQFLGKKPLKEVFWTFVNTKVAYGKAGMLEEWLKESERIGIPARDELWPQPLTIYTIYRSSAYAWQLKQTEYGIQIAEEFIDYVRNHPHPYRRAYMLDIYGQPLLASYATLKWNEKSEAAIADIDQLLDGYEDEWREMQDQLESMNDEDLKEWDETFGDFDSGYVNKKKEQYPVDGDREAIRQWLDLVYKNAIDAANHQIGCVFGWKGDADRAIDCFLRKSNQEGAIHNMFLAQWMLLRKERESALDYVKRASQDRHAVASGYLERCFQDGGFKPVQEDPEFLELINTSL